MEKLYESSLYVSAFQGITSDPAGQGADLADCLDYYPKVSKAESLCFEASNQHLRYRVLHQINNDMNFGVSLWMNCSYIYQDYRHS
jgi:hypothetical protein